MKKCMVLLTVISLGTAYSIKGMQSSAQEQESKKEEKVAVSSPEPFCEAILNLDMKTFETMLNGAHHFSENQKVFYRDQYYAYQAARANQSKKKAAEKGCCSVL